MRYRLDSTEETARTSIIEALKDGPATRAQLAKMTGYARTSLSTHINDLLQQGAICETIKHVPRGRPKGILAINEGAVQAIGISLDRSGAWWVGVNPLGKVLAQGRLAEFAGSRDDFKSVQYVYNTVLESLDITTTTRLGVALPHLVSPDIMEETTEKVLSIAQDVSDASSIVVDNSVRLAAYAHAKRLGLRNALYVRVSAGIGAGVINESTIVAGQRNIAGELGHALIPNLHTKCICGREGCLETIASLPGLARVAGFESTADLITGLQEGDTHVTEALHWLAHHTLTVSAVFDPEQIILDSRLFHEHPWTFRVVKDWIDSAHTGVWKPVPVTLAERLDYASALGAALATIPHD